jgi:hypothetical protein
MVLVYRDSSSQLVAAVASRGRYPGLPPVPFLVRSCSVGPRAGPIIPGSGGAKPRTRCRAHAIGVPGAVEGDAFLPERASGAIVTSSRGSKCRRKGAGTPCPGMVRVRALRSRRPLPVVSPRRRSARDTVHGRSVIGAPAIGHRWTCASAAADGVMHTPYGAGRRRSVGGGRGARAWRLR